MQTLHVSTKEGQVGVWSVTWCWGPCEGTCGRRLQCDGTEEERRWHSPPRHSRAPAAGPQHAATIRRDIAQPPPQWGTLSCQIYNYGFLDVQFCVLAPSRKCMCYIVIPWVQWWVDMSVEYCRIPQPHRLDGMKTIITGVQTFDFSIEADEWRRQSTKQAYIAQTSCTYLSSVFVTQAHLDNLETITTFPKQCNGINFSSQTNIFIEKLSSGLVVPVSGTAPAINIQAIQNYLTGYILDVHIYHERVPSLGFIRLVPSPTW